MDESMFLAAMKENEIEELVGLHREKILMLLEWMDSEGLAAEDVGDILVRLSDEDMVRLKMSKPKEARGPSPSGGA